MNRKKLGAGLIACLLACGGLFAADLTYTTLIPQTNDTDAVITHKNAVAQGKLANGNAYFNMTGVTLTSGTGVKVGAGVLERICINTPSPTANSVILYDGTTTSGATIGTLVTNPTSSSGMQYNVRFGAGLVIKTTGTGLADITVSYR